MVGRILPLLLACGCAVGQRPPVILVDGYHLLCQEDNLSSSHDFGELEQRFNAQGVHSVFFATCSFGGKPSIEELGNALGSTELRSTNLATWNQNRDDLRGVDTIAIISNAGGLGPLEGSNDGTVAVTSASMSFAVPDERTRVLPYCHGAGDLTSILGLGCDSPPLAKIQTDNPLSWQIIDSFLAGTNDWKTVGHSPSQDSYLSKYGGILRQTRDRTDVPVGSLSLAPRMLVSIYGNNLAGSVVTLNGRILPVNYADDHQINTLLTDDVSGVAKLMVSSTQGSQTVNVLAEPAVPAIFSMDGSGTGAAAAIRTGDYLSLYLTGLGVEPSSPSVFLDGRTLPVTYSGPAPTFNGLDQINVQLPSALATGIITVTVGRQASNSVTIPAP